MTGTGSVHVFESPREIVTIYVVAESRENPPGSARVLSAEAHLFAMVHREGKPVPGLGRYCLCDASSDFSQWHGWRTQFSEPEVSRSREDAISKWTTELQAEIAERDRRTLEIKSRLARGVEGVP